MLRPLLVCAAAAVIMFFSACGRALPKYERPIARTKFQRVRTTAYTHTEADHTRHGCQTCQGTRLRAGTINSAAADWSRWPAGTQFRLLDTGELFEVDDIGWALSGRNTIDLYKSSRSEMNRWGVRTVEIEILRWGDDGESLAFLEKRKRYAHCQRMIADLEKRVVSGEQELERTTVAAVSAASPAVVAGPAPAAMPVNLESVEVTGGLRRRQPATGL